MSLIREAIGANRFELGVDVNRSDLQICGCNIVGGIRSAC